MTCSTVLNKCTCNNVKHTHIMNVIDPRAKRKLKSLKLYTIYVNGIVHLHFRLSTLVLFWSKSVLFVVLPFKGNMPCCCECVPRP